MKTALSIAGSDSCGGAGIQADIKTMTMNGVYAMTAITALTAQNTTGVRAIQEATPAFLKEQLDAVFEDIFPDAVKIGMVSSSDLIRVIAERLRHYGAKNIVVDPVMVATSGSSLMKTDAVQTLIDELLPLSTVITPNIPEGEILSGEKIESKDDMERAAKRIGDTYGCAVLLKGGHRVNDANDLLYAGGAGCGEKRPRPQDRSFAGTRHGLHALERHRVEPRQGLLAQRVRRAGEGVHLRRAVGNAGPRQGGGAHAAQF